MRSRVRHAGDELGPRRGTDSRRQLEELVLQTAVDQDEYLSRKAAAGIVDALVAASRLVVEDYYVPTWVQIHDAYSRLGEAYQRGRVRLRWVMCAETHAALLQMAAGLRLPLHSDFRAAAATGEVRALTDDTVFVIRPRWDGGGSLLGMPVRIDPAARWPMFEVDPDGA